MLDRILEPEVMESEQDAQEYNRMDHNEVNQKFVSDLLDFVNQKLVEPDFQFLPETNATGDQSDFQNDLTDEGSNDTLLQVRRLGDILDVGTGTALIPIELCQRNIDCRIMATDLAISMLNLAVYNVSAAGLNEQITLAQSDAKKMNFSDQMFDAVISNSIVHHLPDPQSCIAEIARVLRADGIVFVRDLARPADIDQLNQLVSTYAGRESEYSQKLFADSLHAALTIQEMRDLVQPLGFAADSVQMTSDRHWTWAAVKRLEKSHC